MTPIVMSPEVYDEVLSVARWYAATPESRVFSAGDRFHENVSEFFACSIPDDSYDEDQYFFSHFEIVDEELVACLGYQDGSDDDLQVKVVRG